MSLLSSSSKLDVIVRSSYVLVKSRQSAGFRLIIGVKVQLSELTTDVEMYEGPAGKSVALLGEETARLPVS